MNYFVSLDLILVADKSYVEEVILPPQLSECNADVGFEVCPAQKNLLICHLQISLFSFERDSETPSIKYSPEVIFDDFDNTGFIPRYPDLHSTDHCVRS